ncbi:MAG: XRE family transcriptional regulator [Eubacteriales bacterium]|nr:XRE family transcriptional regulator [Eubacteriales bacterium]
MKEQKILAQRIMNLCRDKRMSYYLLSYKSGVPITTIMNIVHCTTKNPGVFTVFKLCDGFGISVKDFFNTEEFENLQRDSE